MGRETYILILSELCMESAVESSKDQTSKSDGFVPKYFLKALYSACARAQFHDMFHEHKWLSCFPVQQSIGSLEKDSSHISLPPRFM